MRRNQAKFGYLLQSTGWMLAAVLLSATCQVVQAEEVSGDVAPVVVVGEPTGLVLEPAMFELKGVRAEQFLLLTGQYGSEELRDLTSIATYTSSDPNIAKIENGVVRPVGNGTATVTAQVGALTATAAVTVAAVDQPHPVSFKNEVLAALTKSGCNMGACHGSPSGKGGFRLSLRGYDPPLDIMTLKTEYFGRRTNVMAPEESLLLKKPLMEVAHGGGRRIRKDEVSFQVLRNWIGEGMQLDAAEVANLDRIEVFPPQRTLQQECGQQQVIVLGYFSDGSVRDVTSLCVFSSSNESVATVSATGLVSKIGRGESAILARILDKMVTSHVTFLEQVPGFAWTNPETKNFVDQRIFEKLLQLQILPSDICSDEEFLRRAYLDTTGRLPNLSETEAFLADASADKRAKLVDQLLASDDFASFWTLKWSDILRSNSKKLKLSGVHKFRRWVYDAMRNDKPLNDFVYELITARGSVNENPAANYWRASRDPNDATETTAQLFLGIRIQCAKCHNHPFERWTQDNYYGIAAAFTRIGRKNTVDPDEEVIFVTDSGEITQPRTGQQMKVHLLLQGDVDVPATEDRREVFAQWLVAPSNPFFAKATVNRIWGHVMGRGIVEPVDDFRDSNPPSNDKLLDELAAGFVQNNFSQKWVIRTIMNSRTYQLSSRKNDFNANDEIYFSHANTRLLSAEQLLDAICEVTGAPESYAGLPAGTRAVELPDPPTDHYFLKIFGQPQREMACQCERSNESNLSQALQMINGPVVHNKLRADNGRIATMLAAEKTDDEIIRSLYLTALCRQPSDQELEAATKHIAASADRRLAMEDIGWAILNSKEFLFQH
ncbi:MAG: DUF1553 domain-containing protein [Planctomycetota bacterium]|nr:DUF1553 domain-containing protein [Planctomycetota bacterium]MDA1212524.1 DUF1553 domain-containing protein [Planctomycetota bacterium]